jgi:hypothetical protein
MIWDAGEKTSELAASAIIDSAIGTPLLLRAAADSELHSSQILDWS